MGIKPYIEHAFKNDLIEMRESLHLALMEKVALVLEEKKLSIASKLLNQEIDNDDE